MHDQLFTHLQTLSEGQLHSLIGDLLRAMGYKRVTITHGSLEAGRDLVFLEVDRLGREIWRAVQAKVTSISGNLSASKGLRSILQQCQAALDTDFLTPSGEKVHIKEVWLITTKSLTENAKYSVSGMLGASATVEIIDGAHLSDLLDQYLPDLIRSGSKPIEDYLVDLIDYCDSVEQYISLRLNARFSLSDVFVPTRLEIKLISQDVVDALPPLSRQIAPPPELDRNLEAIADLIDFEMLPAILHFQVTDWIERLRALLFNISTIPWYEMSREDVLANLSSLSLVLGLDSLVDSDSLPQDKKPPLVTEEVLHQIEEQLSMSEHEKVKPLRDYKHALDPGYGSNTRDFFVARDRMLTARNQFFTALRWAYKSSINSSEPMTQVAIEAAECFYKKFCDSSSLKRRRRSSSSALNDVATARQIVKLLHEKIDDFHSELVARVKRLWQEIELPLKEMRVTGVLDMGALQSFMELEQLSRFLRQYHAIAWDANTALKFDAVDTCLKARKFVLLGDLGQGKTTILKQVAKRMAGGVTGGTSQVIPIFCSLATLKDLPEEALTNHILQSSKAGFRGLENFATDEIACLLDGFDEVQSSQLKENILELFGSSQRSFAKIIISSRLHSIAQFLPDGMTGTLLPFSREDIERFIHQFPWESKSHSEPLLKVLRDAPELFDLATSPLLLTLIAVVAQKRGPEKLPKRKEGLYKLIIELLLGEWDASKGVVREAEVSESDEERMRSLEKTAYWLYEHHKRSFTREEFVDATIAAQKPKIISIESALHFFRGLVRDCVIIPLGKNDFGFFHFSIQEYLAAANLCHDVYPARLIAAIQEFFSDGWWEDVLVFYAGIKRDIGSLLEDLHNKSFPAYTKGDVLNPNFLRLLQRMLRVADLTDMEKLVVHGPVAAAFRHLNVEAIGKN